MTKRMNLNRWAMWINIGSLVLLVALWINISRSLMTVNHKLEGIEVRLRALELKALTQQKTVENIQQWVQAQDPSFTGMKSR